MKISALDLVPALLVCIACHPGLCKVCKKKIHTIIDMNTSTMHSSLSFAVDKLRCTLDLRLAAVIFRIVSSSEPLVDIMHTIEFLLLPHLPRAQQHCYAYLLSTLDLSMHIEKLRICILKSEETPTSLLVHVHCTLVCLVMPGLRKIHELINFRIFGHDDMQFIWILNALSNLS